MWQVPPELDFVVSPRGQEYIFFVTLAAAVILAFWFSRSRVKRRRRLLSNLGAAPVAMATTAAPALATSSESSSTSYRFIELRPVANGEDPWSATALTAAISQTTLPPGDNEAQEKVRQC